MSTELRINEKNGHVTLDGYQITPQTKPDSLPPFFKVGNEMPVQVLRKKIPCIFASTRVAEEDIEITVDLRFENKELVSVFFELTDKTRDYTDEATYYGSVVERENLHLLWLKKKLGSPQGKYTSYKWGVVGVAQDRSGGVHVFLHNNNNTWASGGANA